MHFSHTLLSYLEPQIMGDPWEVAYYSISISISLIIYTVILSNSPLCQSLANWVRAFIGITGPTTECSSGWVYICMMIKLKGTVVVTTIIYDYPALGCNK